MITPKLFSNWFAVLFLIFVHLGALMVFLIACGSGQSTTNSEDSMKTRLRPTTNVVSEFTVVPKPSEETDKSEENEQNYPTPTAKGLVATIPLRELSGDIVPNDESLEAFGMGK